MEFTTVTNKLECLSAKLQRQSTEKVSTTVIFITCLWHWYLVRILVTVRHNQPQLCHSTYVSFVQHGLLLSQLKYTVKDTAIRQDIIGISDVHNTE